MLMVIPYISGAMSPNKVFDKLSYQRCYITASEKLLRQTHKVLHLNNLFDVIEEVNEI